MVQYVIIEAVPSKQVALVIDRVDRPVIAQLFGAQHQNTVISQLVIFDDGKGLEGFTEGQRCPR